MILVCEVCGASLQLDEKKAPVGKFTIRCPKCKNLVRVDVPSGVSETGNEIQAQTVASIEPQIGTIPSQTSAAYKPQQPETPVAGSEKAANVPADFMSLIANLLKQTGAGTVRNKPEGDAGRVLLCLAPEKREPVARLLTEAGWEVFLAEDPTQAIETINDSGIETLIFSNAFAPEHKGAAALQKHFNMLTATERRRLFLVLLENDVQTLNVHEAFLRNLNLLVNSVDANSLPKILRKARRDFHEVYRHFNKFLIDA